MTMRDIPRQRERQLRRRHRRVRKKIVGSAARPRLVVHRSIKNIQGHLTDDVSGRVLFGVSTLAPELKALRDKENGGKTTLSKAAGALLAEKAKAAGITTVVFDRGGYPYHGRVAAFAEGAREGGLAF